MASARITVEHLSGARAGQREEFDAVSELRFGRHPKNDVVFDARSDIDASAYHAELRTAANGFVLLDVGSSNGTLINGARVQTYNLAFDEPVEVEFGVGGPRCRLSLEHATERPAQDVAQTAPPAERSSGFMRSVVDQAVRRSTRRATVIAGIVVVVAGAAMLALLLTRGSGGSGADSGASIASRNHDAVFLLAVGQRSFCTAFAIDEQRLATNAHCMIGPPLKRIVAIRNGHPGDRYRIVKVHTHPDYQPRSQSLSPDVAVLELDRAVPSHVTLATRKHVLALRSGGKAYLYGFPKRIAFVNRPEASLTDGIVGRITTFSGVVAEAAKNQLVQHTAFISGGTSGSPIFDAAGQVIAVNFGGYSGSQGEIASDPRQPDGGAVKVRSALQGYNTAVRIDALLDLLASL